MVYSQTLDYNTRSTKLRRWRWARFVRKLTCVSSPDAPPSLSSSSASAISSSFDDEKRSHGHGVVLNPSLSRSTIVGFDPVDVDEILAYADFLVANPQYRVSAAIDSLRHLEFARLAHADETYLDYMGGSLYPEALVRSHANFLAQSIMGNTHSVSNSSQLSSTRVAEARAAVLRFFDAPEEYTVVFTANTTASLKLVGESYPFDSGSSYVLPADCHNSVNGIRQFAVKGGASVHYLECAPRGGIDLAQAEMTLAGISMKNKNQSPCLYAITGMSNISNTKTPLSIAKRADELGFHVLLDAAALAPSTRISLRDTPVHAMAVSFYKMFGYPTGVGALIVKKDFLRVLRRPWFAGGTVDVVQVPGTLVTMAPAPEERFEDGTMNYLTLYAITQGLEFFEKYLALLPYRLNPLIVHMTSRLQALRHEGTDRPVVEILSRLPSDGPHESGAVGTGYTVSLIFTDAQGEMIPNSFIEYAATQQRISIRTGCVCNPGGAATLLGIQGHMNLLSENVTLREFECRVGRELGVVRISLGLVSSFADVQKFVQFAASIGRKDTREKMWNDWKKSSPVGH